MKYFVLLKKNKNYCHYFIGQMFSRFGDVLFRIALTWLVLEVTDSALYLGLTMLVNYLPKFLAGFFTGIIVDKHEKKILMLISDVTSGIAVLVFSLFVVFGYFNIILVFIVMFILSLMDTIYDPATLSFVPYIVDKSELLTANSLLAVLVQIMNVIGAAVSAYIIIFIGTKIVFIINAITYFLSAFIIWTIPVVTLVSNENSLIKISLDEMVVSVRYILKDSFTKWFIALVAICNIAYSVIYMLPSIYSKVVLGSDIYGYSMIETAIAIGMVIGIYFIGIIKINYVTRWFLFGNFVGGLLMILLSSIPSLGMTLIIYFLFGMTDAISIPSYTYLQLHTPEEIRGRVYAVIDAIILSAVPLGSMITGLLSDYIGVNSLLFATGIILLSTILFCFVNRGFCDAQLSKYTE